MPTVPTVLTVLPVPMAIFVACHKKKKMLTPKKTNKTPKKKKASKKKPLKVNPGGQPEGKKNYTWAETLHMLDILEDVLPVFVWRSGKLSKQDMQRLGPELIEMYPH